MKKIILNLLVLVSVFFLVGCREERGGSGDIEDEKTVSHQSVSYIRGEGSIRFELPVTWRYAVVDEEEGTGFAIEIWPETQSSGKLSLKYCDDGFGVCGTELKAEKITIGQYEAEKGVYVGSNFWNYISLMGVPRSYVIINEGAESWRQEEKDEAMRILSTICVAYESNGMRMEYPEYKVAWVGYAEIDHTQRVPVFQCENLAELNQFKENYKDVFQFSTPYDEIPSFDDVCKNYGQEFFEEYTLLMAYVSECSGSYRYGIESIYIDSDNVILHTKQLNHPEVVTEDLAGWLLTVGVKKEDVETCTVFDADLTISEAEDELVRVPYYKMSDGTWRTDEYSYKYRLEVSGRMNNAAGETTFIILSNRSEITFNEAWKASGFSSNLDDYFDPKEAVIVGSVFYSDQKASELQAEGIDTSILVRVQGELYGRSFAMIDYAGGGKEIGKIAKLTAKENIPQHDWETNTQELMGASVYESTSDSIVLLYNNEYVLFEKIEWIDCVEVSEDFSATGDLLYRGGDFECLLLPKPDSDEKSDR